MELTPRHKEKLRGIIASTSKHRDEIIEMHLLERDKDVKQRLGAAMDQFDDAASNLRIVINKIKG